jgi:hypothetical protein
LGDCPSLLCRPLPTPSTHFCLGSRAPVPLRRHLSDLKHGRQLFAILPVKCGVVVTLGKSREGHKEVERIHFERDTAEVRDCYDKFSCTLVSNTYVPFVYFYVSPHARLDRVRCQMPSTMSFLSTDCDRHLRTAGVVAAGVSTAGTGTDAEGKVTGAAIICRTSVSE